MDVLRPRPDSAPPPFAVLVVDDEIAIQQMFAAALGRRGYSVLTAGGVDAALACLDSTSVNALILDVRMPGKSGVDLLGLVRADTRWCRLPIILLTGGALSEDEERMVARLGAYVFYKPESHVLILEQLRRLQTAHHPAA